MGTHNMRNWVLKFDNRQRWENPLMGWASTGDPLSNTHMEFKTREAAQAYCESHGTTPHHTTPHPTTPHHTTPHTHTQTDTHTHTHTHTHTQTDTHTDRQTHTQTHTDRHTHR